MEISGCAFANASSTAPSWLLTNHGVRPVEANHDGSSARFDRAQPSRRRLFDGLVQGRIVIP
jgi:hypothetical protein